MWCEEGGIEMLRYTAWSGQEICARNPFSVMQVNIKPPKGSWEGVISSKQRIHYHHQKVMWAAGVTRHQKCLFQNFLFETDGMSLKWKGKKKQVIPQTSNIFFPVDTSFDGYKQNWASWASLKQHSRGISWTHTEWDALGSPFRVSHA